MLFDVTPDFVDSDLVDSFIGGGQLFIPSVLKMI